MGLLARLLGLKPSIEDARYAIYCYESADKHEATAQQYPHTRHELTQRAARMRAYGDQYSSGLDLDALYEIVYPGSTAEWE